MTIFWNEALLLFDKNSEQMLAIFVAVDRVRSNAFLRVDF